MKLFGLGLAVAVFIDATIVRLVLVPAAMELIGKRTGGSPVGSTASRRNVNIEAPPDLDAELAALEREEQEASRR